MKKIIIFLAVMLFGSNLVNVNFFPAKNKLDVLLSLDSKFSGKVLKSGENTYIITNINANREYNKEFGDFFIKKIKILPQNNEVLIHFDTKAKYKISVALTPDGYGLRFRIMNTATNTSENITTFVNPQNSLDYFSYIIALAILIILAIVLWIIRKKTVKKFPVKSGMNILFQKPLDTKNRVVLMEFNGRKYLVLVGSSNILLDIFDENMVNISTKAEFDNFLKTEMSEKLDNLQKYIKNAEKLKEFDEKI